jgi:hypothetical protein
LRPPALRRGAGKDRDGGMAERFVSEPLVPDPAAIETAGMENFQNS